MPSPVQNPEYVGRLFELFELTGRYSLAVDDLVAPVVDIRLDGTPFQFGEPVARAGTQAGVVGEFSYILMRPAATSILGLDQIRITNGTGAVQDYEIRINTPAQADALEAGAATLARFQAMNNPINPAGAFRDTASLFAFGTDAALQGRITHIVRLAIDEMAVLEFPRGLFLHGNAQGGRVGLSVWNIAANTELEASAQGVEYSAFREAP